MEKCLYFWLDYTEECSTLLISANNGKAFIFLVKLYRGVFHLIDFSQIMVNCFKFVVRLYNGVFHLIMVSKYWKFCLFLVKLYRGVFHLIDFSKKTEKCSYFWLNHIEECST